MRQYGKKKNKGYGIAGHGHDTCHICKPPTGTREGRVRARREGHRLEQEEYSHQTMKNDQVNVPVEDAPLGKDEFCQLCRQVKHETRCNVCGRYICSDCAWEDAESDGRIACDECYGDIEHALRQQITRLTEERDALRDALHRISLGSQNAQTTKAALGREARRSLTRDSAEADKESGDG